MTSRFVIGIDLGTTNCVVTYAPLDLKSAEIALFPIPQLVAHQTVESRSSLPSFLYLATGAEADARVLTLPWESDPSFAVGVVARALSAEYPERTVSGAKSWLCHSRVDRHEAILPWKAPATVPHVSPVTVVTRLLEHLIAAWNTANRDDPMALQQVVLTVPASFDESARELTREAAIAAGLPESMVLLEEPQAATYAWLHAVGDRWRRMVRAGDRLLVCDVGGGTTDFTLVEVTECEGELSLRRVAVGNHLLVGGDNMDLTLAHQTAQLFREKGVELDPWQSVSLWHLCRQAKESLLSDSGPATQTISVPGRSSRLIGGMVSVEVERQRVMDLLREGFFPDCELVDRPRRPRSSGFLDIGLPYEADTGITRHLAGFLQQHCETAGVTHVVFNGGVFRSACLREALMQQLGVWFGTQPPMELEGSRDLDFGVARGACYYLWSRHHGGVRIRGGTARSYYVGIETAGPAVPGAPRPLAALCVVPQGMEEGTELPVPAPPIGLVVGESARFRFFSSTSRSADRPGLRLNHWSPEELVETDSLEAALEGVDEIQDEYVPVTFRSRITELGIFELWCEHQPSGRCWKLEFSVREAPEQ